jgi:hypothetical protein
MQNLMLVGQAMGIGGWIHGSVFPPYIYQKDPSKNWYGLGFRMMEPKKLHPMPAVPASQPNPVGIDGILEGLTPPYVKSMDEAVEWLKRCPNPMLGISDIEIRPEFDASDFA